MGVKVDCPQNCGLLLEERMIMKKGSVESTESRVRRGCVSDGKELVENSEAKPDMVTGKMGCTNVGEHSYDNIVVVSRSRDFPRKRFWTPTPLSSVQNSI